MRTLTNLLTYPFLIAPIVFGFAVMWFSADAYYKSPWRALHFLTGAFSLFVCFPIAFVDLVRKRDPTEQRKSHTKWGSIGVFSVFLCIVSGFLMRFTNSRSHLKGPHSENGYNAFLVTVVISVIGPLIMYAQRSFTPLINAAFLWAHRILGLLAVYYYYVTTYTSARYVTRTKLFTTVMAAEYWEFLFDWMFLVPFIVVYNPYRVYSIAKQAWVMVKQMYIKYFPNSKAAKNAAGPVAVAPATVTATSTAAQRNSITNNNNNAAIDDDDEIALAKFDSAIFSGSSSTNDGDMRQRSLPTRPEQEEQFEEEDDEDEGDFEGAEAVTKQQKQPLII